MTNCKNTGIVSLENLPENLVIDLEPKFKRRLFLIAKKEFKEWINLSTKLDLNYINLIRGKNKRDKPKPIYFFKKICKYLERKGYNEFKLKKLEKHIILLRSKNGNKGIENPKLPFNFNSYEGGCFISSILHDGSIKTRESVNYCNKRDELRDKVIKISKDLFGKVHYSHNRYINLFPKVIGEILIHCLRMKKGRKSISNAHIPEFLLKYPNKKTMEGYLDFAISDDGCVDMNKKYGIYRIRINLSKNISNLKLNKINNHIPNLLMGDKLILEKLGINVNKPFLTRTYKHKDKYNKNRISLEWEISITNLNDIEKFYKNIKLTHKIKQKRLEKIIKITNKKHRLIKKGNVFKETLINCNKLLDINKQITASELSKTLNRSLGRTQWILKRMVKKNLIKKIGEIPENQEYIYKIT